MMAAMEKMKRKRKTMRMPAAILKIVAGGVLISGCSGPAPSSTHMPSTQNTTSPSTKTLSSIPSLTRAGKLVQADEVYATWRAAHEDTPQIPHIIVALAKAHMEAGEYLLARFYLNEYRRDFPSGKERDRIEYLGVRTLFLQYRQSKDDRFIAPFMAQGKAFKRMFPHSKYRTKVQSLIVKMRQLKNAHYRELAAYYEKRGKPKAAAFYRRKIRGN